MNRTQTEPTAASSPNAGKHTPGPLIAMAPSGYPFHTKAWLVQSDRDDLNGGYVTATCNGPDAEANAKLYASAPQLLADNAALREALANVLSEAEFLVRFAPGGNKGDRSNAMLAARAVLARTGKGMQG